ncbi:OmpA family protein [Antarctobacter jejuensis]|uniref:OmpA family protein n=1 Tax=Antarctobacter jejuensis TaxID=1439938 RepID=UPI003FD6A78C
MTLRSSNRLGGLGLALWIGLSALPGQADQAADIQALITALAPTPDQKESSAAAEAAEVHGKTIYLVPAYSADLEVFFALDSYELTWQAQQDLAALGHALVSPALRPYRYLVAGHTDATGDAGHNQWLSERRAESVVRFLIQNFPIDPMRLIAVGWGESRLKTPGTPNAAINRRVEVTLMLPYAPEASAPAPSASAVDPEPVEGMDPAPQPEPLPGTLQKDKDGNITITW